MIIFPLPYQIEKDTKLVANVQHVIFYHFSGGIWSCFHLSWFVEWLLGAVIHDPSFTVNRRRVSRFDDSLEGPQWYTVVDVEKRAGSRRRRTSFDVCGRQAGHLCRRFQRRTVGARLCHHDQLWPVEVRTSEFFEFKMGQSWPLFCLFSSFQHVTIKTQI